METATLEAPASRGFFTRENAAFFAAKGNDKLRSLRARTRELAQIGSDTESQRNAERSEIEVERARLLEMMRKSKDADEIQKLSAARARLFAEWQVLTGTPNPGSRRAKQSRPQAPVAVPTEPTTPQVPPADTTRENAANQTI